MATLTWKNVDAPDMGRVADILNMAANQWSGGFGKAGDALRGFRETQQEQRSAAAAPILARVASEQGVDAALAQMDQII